MKKDRPHGVPRRRNRHRTLNAKKPAKSSQHNLNFLEKLLVFCVMRELRVPKESGVRFYINDDSHDRPLFLLFHIDREQDPLITEGARPDYMVLCVKGRTCICTIIEMKGRSERGLEHGIEQIKAFRDRIRREVRDNLPTKMKITYQGILLTPFNSQVPKNKILKESSSGFVILPLQYDHSADLSGYVSKMNKLSDRYEHPQSNKKSTMKLLEQVITHGASPTRMKDEFYSENYRDREVGIYLNYELTTDGEYAILKANNNTATIASRDLKALAMTTLIQELRSLGIDKCFNVIGFS